MKSILLIRLSAIGDVVMASPLIKAIRRRYPDAHIAWLVQPEVKELLSANPDLDEVIVWPRNQWLQLWKQRQWLRLAKELSCFRRMLRERRFEFAVDVQGLLKSGMMAWLSGAKNRIGLGSKEGSALLMTRVIAKPENDPRIGSEYLHIARKLGWDSERFEMEIALHEDDECFAQEFVEREKLTGGYVIFAPFTTRPQKHWIGTYWSELARHLYRSHGLPVVVLGGPEDIEVSDHLAGLIDTPIHELAGKTTLRQSAAVIGKARLVVGVDTGLTHMGIAMDVPTIALFGSTCPYMDPASTKARVIYKHYSCSPCRRNPVCDGDFSCMRTISVDEVTAVAKELLQ